MAQPAMTFEALQDYVYCSYLYYWRHELKRAEAAQPTTLDLPGRAFRQALKLYAASRAGSLPEGVAWVWRDWVLGEARGSDGDLTALAGYTQVLGGILEEFTSGQIRKRDGSAYKEPRMSSRFRRMAKASGLPALATQLDKALLGPLGVVRVSDRRYGTYGVGDAFADSLRMAELAAADATFPRPQAILGAGVPADVRVGKWRLGTTADLIIQGDGEDLPPAVYLEVHDPRPGPAPRAVDVSRDLRLIAALNLAPSRDEPQFGVVQGVTFRHLASGRTHRRQAASAGRLTFALEAALQGIVGGVFLPMFLVDRQRCESCGMHEICLNPGGMDALEVMAPGMASRG